MNKFGINAEISIDFIFVFQFLNLGISYIRIMSHRIQTVGNEYVTINQSVHSNSMKDFNQDFISKLQFYGIY